MTRDLLKYCSLTILILVISFCCFGQQADFNVREQKKISKSDFDSLVDNSISLLKTKKLKKITDQEHIDIMYCLNTIFVLGTMDIQFREGRYSDLEALERQTEYSKKIINVYTDWTFNKGMGWYFPKLKMELYGTPSIASVYQIVD